MDYDRVYQSYVNYVDKCREKINNVFLNENDLSEAHIISNDGSIKEIVTKHRLKMIDIKFEHTMRMIEQVIKINDKLGIKINLDMVIRVAVMYHDIGRMRQATWSDTFSDYSYLDKKMPFKNHSEDGYDIFLNNDFNIDDKYVPVIGTAILYHQEPHIQPKLGYRYENGLEKINIDNIVTGNFILNDAEWEVASLILQLVADLDKTDILYQHLTDDLEMVRDYIWDNSLGSLEEISEYWCVPKQEIIDYNMINENSYVPMRVMVPIKNMDLNRLIVPRYMRDMFYNNSWLELRELSKDRNWTFITVLWWRLSHFLNQISFNSVLINIEESKLLDRIYDKVPKELRFLVDEAFCYARDFLVHERIKENKGKIYLKK